MHSITLEAQLEQLFSKAKKMEAIDPIMALAEAEKAFDLALRLDDINIQIDCLIFMGQLNRIKGNYYQSLSHLKRAHNLANSHYTEDVLKKALVYIELGSTHADGLGDFHQSLDYFFKALQYNIPELCCRLYNNIGSVYKDIGQFEKAIHYLLKGDAYAVEQNNFYHRAFMMENLGVTYYELGQYQEAESYFLKGLKICEDGINAGQPFHFIHCVTLQSLGKCETKQGAISKAEEYFNEGLLIATERGFKAVIAELLQSIGDMYALQKSEKRFLEYYRQALEYARQHDLFAIKQACLNRLREFFEGQGDFQMAYTMAKEVIANHNLRENIHRNQNIIEYLNERESKIVILEEKNKKISLQKEELEQFAHIVAHDLKEPLRNMGNYSGLLKKRYAKLLDEHGVQFLDFINTNAEHMYLMLEELLTFTSLSTELRAVGLVDAQRLLYVILEQMRGSVKEAKAIINYESLPLVNIRGAHLEMLFQHLIANALKFRKADQICLIDITATDEGGNITFKVSDNGIGIAEKYHQRIFQLFKRLDKANYQGTGMGLAICKKIIDLYSGTIWVESEEGQGTTFFFQLPKKIK